MSAAGILAIITGVFQFPNEVLALIRALRETPEEQHAALVQAIQDESNKFKQTGRPTW